MKKPSPYSHLYRLAIIFVVAFIGYFVIRDAVAPESWDYDVWFRMAALEDLKESPMTFGGISDIDPSLRNESCVGCHQAEHDEMVQFAHKTVSCEVCHGPLADHVQDEQKVADATVDSESNWACLNCHQALISRPKDFPQFRRVETHAELEEEDIVCVLCHGPHNPTP